MSTWKINLTNIGRGKVCRTLKIEAKTLPVAETKALRECKKHLASRNVGIMHTGNLTYTIMAGFRGVGEVNIETA